MPLRIRKTGGVCAAFAACAGPVLAQTPPAVTPDAWTATDALGRTLPDATETGPPRVNRTVGIFYFLWLGEHGSAGPFDITRILRQDPDALQKPGSPLWGPMGAPHHWGESVFGYYRADDPYVLRKHAQMLSDAGVDTVVFDVTNQLTYPRSYNALGKTWTQIRQEGGRTPQFAFLCPFGDPSAVVQTLYEDLYRPNKYRNLWFRWEGKPLILADPAAIRADRMGISRRVPGLLAKNSTYGQTFVAEKPFTAVGGPFPTYSGQNSSVTVSLYAGDKPGGKLIARRRFVNHADNAVALLTLPEAAPPGAYYLEQSAADGAMGWWSETGNVYDGGTAWENGTAAPGDRYLSLRYADAAPDAPLVELVKPRPMDGARAEALAQEIRAFFTFRKPQPDYFTGPTGPGQWGWLEVFPQHAFYKTTPNIAEQVTVGVAQNAVRGHLSVLSHPDAHGRSFHDGKEPPPAERDFTGRNFQEQWDRARALDPPFVFVTGWNEWIAGRFGADAPFYEPGPVAFVDQFDTEHSRDIEPMVGGHTDSYYYQLVANVRRYKGMASLPAPAAPRTQRPGTDNRLWRTLGTAWADDAYDTPARDYPGWSYPTPGPAYRYTNPGGANDLVEIRAAHDADTLYLYARTREPLRALSAPHALSVLLTAQGTEFALNRAGSLKPDKSGAVRLRLERRMANQGTWETVRDGITGTVRGSEMCVAIPRTFLNLSAGAVTLDLKWLAGIDAEADPLNLYRDGDTAPNGRFYYRYRGQ